MADWVLGLRVRIPPGAWMSVVFECVLSDKRSVRRADHPSRGVISPWVCFMRCTNLSGSGPHWAVASRRRRRNKKNKSAD